jgi:predicted nucleic acid-binding protein
LPDDRRAAGKLKAEWRRISLADCFALALALGENGTLLTADHHELDRLAQEAIAPIRFIR